MILHMSRIRRWALLGACCLPLLALVSQASAQGGHQTSQGDFRRFVETLWPEAQAKGVSRATFEAAFRGVRPNLKLPDLILPGRTRRDVKGQAEFTRTPAQYLNVRHLARLARRGRALRAKYRDTLRKIERRIGVPGEVVLAIWGRESAFGTHRARHDAIRALATQAWLGRRKEMFRSELIYALKMLQDGVRTRDNMRSSWAGAMGLTQFMPSDYYALAYDLNGDGRKDIWGSVPDALASAANQLRGKGWVPGHPWGLEVHLPDSVTCRLEGPPNARTVREWARLGVVRTRGRRFPANVLDAQAFILTPGGAYGPAFLALENFMVIKRYNMSDLYALFVGDLSDRIAGGGTFAEPWGKVRQLSAHGIAEIQSRLKGRAYGISIVDGKAGMNTRSVIGAYQHANGLKEDCWPSTALLGHIRRAQASGDGVQRRIKSSLEARR